MQQGAIMSEPSNHRNWFAYGGSQAGLYRIFLIVIVLIVYGSLYPWHFHSTQLVASALWVLIHSWPTHNDRLLLRDMAVNLLIFVPVGGFGFLAFRQNLRTAVAVTVTLLIALVLSSSIEMIQLFDDERFCTATDVVFNVSGTAVGVVLRRKKNTAKAKATEAANATERVSVVFVGFG